MPGLKEAFEHACTCVPKTLDHWTMGWVSEQDMYSDKPSKQIWRQIEPILDSVYKVKAHE